MLLHEWQWFCWFVWPELVSIFCFSFSEFPSKCASIPAVIPDSVASTGLIIVKGSPKNVYDVKIDVILNPDVETKKEAATESLTPFSFRVIAAGTMPQEHMGSGSPIKIPFKIPPIVEVPISLFM